MNIIVFLRSIILRKFNCYRRCLEQSWWHFFSFGFFAFMFMEKMNMANSKLLIVCIKLWVMKVNQFQRVLWMLLKLKLSHQSFMNQSKKLLNYLYQRLLLRTSNNLHRGFQWAIQLNKLLSSQNTILWTHSLPRWKSSQISSLISTSNLKKYSRYASALKINQRKRFSKSNLLSFIGFTSLPTIWIWKAKSVQCHQMDLVSEAQQKITSTLGIKFPSS